MANRMIRQTMFSTGEVDVTTWKRTDVNEYLTAAQSLENAEVGTTGLAKKRKGTLLLGNVTSCGVVPESNMYEFIDANGNYYLVISEPGHFCIYSAPTVENNVIDWLDHLIVTKRGSFVVAHPQNLTYLTSVAMPYQKNDLDNLDYTQDNDSLIFTSPNYAPGRLYISQYNGGSPPTFAFQYLDIYPLPAYDYNQINYNNTTVTLSVLGNVLTIKFAGLPAGATYTNAWIGGQIVGGGATDIDPVGYAIITAVSQASPGADVTFTATVQIPFQTTGYATAGSQYSIKQPVWVPPASPWPAVNPVTTGYPAKVLFFQNRLWLANTNTLPATIFGSKINQPINFDVGTGRDTDAIIYTIGQTNTGGILWMNGGKQLEIYTQNYEFACPQDQNAGLTPSTFSIRQQSSYGASPLLKPITYINDSYYSTSTGKALINYHFNGIGLTYSSSNISAASSHLVQQPTNRALLRGSDTSQDNFIYFLSPITDTLTAFQFASEYKLAALTPIVFQDNVELVDICTVDNTVYILKYYKLTQQYTVEAFDEDTYTDCQFFTSMNSNGLVTGLSLLEGYTVQVVYQNQDFGQYVVSGGQITVNNGGVSGTVAIGLLYDVEIKPMYFFDQPASSPFFKQVTRIYVDYYNSLNFYINGNLVPYQSFSNIQAGLPLVPQTDTAIYESVGGYNRFATFSITQSSPFDLQILSIGYEISSAVI